MVERAAEPARIPRESHRQHEREMAEFSKDDTPGAFFKKLRDKVVEPFAAVKPLPGSIVLKVTETFSKGATKPEDRNTILKMMAEEELRSSAAQAAERKQQPYRLQQFEQLLSEEDIDMTALRKLAWNGVPAQHRCMVWQLLLGYAPTNKSRRDATLARKRSDYRDSVHTYLADSDADRTSHEGETMRQIRVDLPRTSPDTPFFQQQPVQRAMERVLYVWSIRHPASSYVQGINDLLTPILLVCCSAFVADPLRCDVGALEADTLQNIEADAYWCLTKLLDYIQDHYTSAQPGIQRMVLRLEDLVRRVDLPLHAHIDAEGMQFMQFAFRWMNCLLLRELPLVAILRLWDSYLSEERSGFEHFHVYVCTVLLTKHRDALVGAEFTDMLTLLQDLPTHSWGEEDVEPILAQAYIYSTLFEDSPSHLR